MATENAYRDGAQFTLDWDAMDRQLGDSPESVLHGVIARLAAPLVDSAARTLEGGGSTVWEPLERGVGPLALWEDLRPSEAIELMELVGAEVDQAAAACQSTIALAIARAGSEFVRRHPEVRRVAG